METLRRFAIYNAWANRQVWTVVHELDAAALSADAGGTPGTLADTIAHLVGVEERYLVTLNGNAPEDTRAWREQYMQHDSAWFMQRFAEISAELVALLAARDASFLEEPFMLPWLTAPITVRDALLQVLTHSAHHRAQILTTLGGRGLQMPDIDYILMLAEAGTGSA